MKKVVFPGSFDPFTNGHLDVVRRAANLFDEVVIAVGTNKSKQYMFSAEEKIALIEATVSNLENVKVVEMSGLAVEFVKALGAQTMVRGLRNQTDYQYERDIAEMNYQLGGVETVFLMARPENQNISSSILKEVASFGADISNLVPDPVAEALAERYKR
ncbi:pantetheine-phosphate adenylyltransferase [Weissella muntiaci]|uniref:Phosphopantetheine adenylyltransferase n=1 Tax=Weissella muntiaci TaxID=2508881 RepID=A0A6C2C2W4_9LACO|nr:pantetheine-phosphate adenylyltransferase [Weissella muntiaci]TYC48049.1 pantetheine-phosphate adenylyltransferase [Weissella muntiaci]